MLLPEEYTFGISDRVLWNAVEKVKKRILKASSRWQEEEYCCAILSCRYHNQNFTTTMEQAAEWGVCDGEIINSGKGNPHAHILLTTRPFKENGDQGNKKKSLQIDAYGGTGAQLS